MNEAGFQIAVIRGDGIGVDVTDATLAIVDAARARIGGFRLDNQDLLGGAHPAAKRGTGRPCPAPRRSCSADIAARYAGIYQLLTVLEPKAAADVAEAGLSSVQIARLEAATAEMEQALKVGNLDLWAAADDRFHRELLNGNANGRLTAFVQTLFDQAHRARIVTLHLRDVPWKSTEDHRDILKAVTDGDAAWTRKLFRAHRERAAQELLRVLEKSRISQL